MNATGSADIREVDALISWWGVEGGAGHLPDWWNGRASTTHCGRGTSPMRRIGASCARQCSVCVRAATADGISVPS